MAKKKSSIGFGGILIGVIIGAGVVYFLPNIKRLIPGNTAALARYR